MRNGQRRIARAPASADTSHKEVGCDEQAKTAGDHRSRTICHESHNIDSRFDRLAMAHQQFPRAWHTLREKFASDLCKAHGTER